MKKIVPFTKDLMFKTKIGEITSIALDNTLKLDNENVAGEFIISGTYKMLESSQIEEEFKYNIPVDITIDSKYETKNCTITIDDFYYEIINEEKLKVNISVMLDDLDIKEDPVEKVEVMVSTLKDDKEDRDIEEKQLDDRDSQEFDYLLDELEESSSMIKEETQKIMIKDNEELKKKEKVTSIEKELFENTNKEKEYSIYRVYTMKEEDTLELIYEKFNTTKELLMDYNDLDNLVIGSKIIIPSLDE